jgi:predicted ATPase
MPMLRLSTVEVDLETGVLADGSRLANTERALLAWLAAHPNEDIDRERLLREVWNFPGNIPETRAVDLAMARLRRKVERDPSQPEHLVTIQGVGYRFVPLAETAPAPLPIPANTFVGRQTERARIGAALDAGARLVTLVGPGGVGKTRLALEVAASRRPAWFCDASDARDAAGLDAALGQGLRGPGRHRAVEQLLGELGPGLVVLDNLEQVVDAAATAIPAWLAQAPGLVVLATSREALGLVDEHLVDVEPLLGRRLDEGVALLVARAAQMGVDLDRSDPDVVELVGRMDGLPLGLELAAARLRSRGPRELAGDLDAPRRGVPARHRSLDAAVAWSWEWLGDEDRAALEALAEFRGTFTAGSALALGVSSDRVDALVQRSLVQRYGESGRWGLLETVRRFVRAHQRDAGALADRHLAWCLASSEEPEGPTRADLEAAVEHAITTRHPGALEAFLRLRLRVYHTDTLERLEALVRTMRPRLVSLGDVWALDLDLAMLHEMRGDLAEATASLQALARTASDTGAVARVATVEGNLAEVRMRLGQIREALAHASSAVTAARRAFAASPAPDVRRMLALRLQLLGGLELRVGRPAQAWERTEEAMALSVPWPATRGSVRHLQALILHLLGRPVEEVLDEAAALTIDAPRYRVVIEGLRITTRQDRGDFEGARVLLETWQGAPFLENPVLATQHAVAVARDLAARGAPEAAEERLVAVYDAAGEDRWIISRLAPVLVAVSRPERARAVLAASLTEAAAQGTRYDEVLLHAAACGRADATPDERIAAREAGRALCDEMQIEPDGWLRAAFE